MKSIVLLLLVALPAQASDAPLAELGTTVLYDIRPIKAGEVSPLTGRVMDDGTYVALGQRIASAEAERDALKAAPPVGLSGFWIALLVACGVAGGVYLGSRIQR